MNFKMKNLKAFSLFVFTLLAIGFTSCSKEEAISLVDASNFTDASISSLQRGAIGKKHCLEFIFPISLEFNDGTTADVESYEDLKDTVQDWFETSGVEPSKENRPDLVFPIEVVNMEGEIISVATQDELSDLKGECPKQGKCGNGKNGKGYKCFSLVYPINLTAMGETYSFDDRSAMKQFLRAYKQTNGPDADRPELEYPVTVEYEDGTQVQVNSSDEMTALKEACQDDESGDS